MKSKKNTQGFAKKLSTQVRSLTHPLELLLDPFTPVQPMYKRVQANIKGMIIRVHQILQEKH